MRRFLWMVVLLLCGIAFWAGRLTSRPAAVAPAPATAPAVASWDGGVLLESDVTAALSELAPQGRARFREPAARRELTRELARNRVLAQLARSEGLDRQPDVARRCTEALSSAYVERHFEATRAVEPAQAEVQAWYDAHPETYSHPETVRVAHILLRAPAGTSGAARRPEGQRLLAELQKKSATDYYAFANAAQAKSEDGLTRAAGGELAPMQADQLAAQLGAGAMAAIAPLRPGEIAPALVESEAGMHLLRLIERRPASSVPFERVRESIAQQLRTQRKAAAWSAFLEEVERRAGLAVDDAALERLVVP